MVEDKEFKAPEFKIHGVKGGNTTEFAATSSLSVMLNHARICGEKGLEVVIYRRVNDVIFREDGGLTDDQG